MYRIIFWIISFLIVACSSIRIRENITVNKGEDWLYRGGDIENTNTSKSKAMLNPPFSILWDYDTEVGYPSNSLSVSDGILFSSNLKGEVFAIDVTTGKSIGRFSTPGKTSYSTPIIFNDNIIIAFSSSDLYSILSYNILQGEVIWIRQLGWIKSSPILIDEEIIVCATNGKIFKLDALSGNKIWEYSEGGNNIERKSFNTSPVACNQFVVAGNINYYLYAVNISDGKLRWKFKTNGAIYSDASVFENKIYFASDDLNYYCLDTTGNLLWKKPIKTKSLSSSTFYNDKVITAGINGSIIAMDKNTGELLWTSQTNGSVWASPLLQGDKIFIGSFDRNFYCIDANDGNLLWKYELDNRIRTNAVVWKDYIFTACDDKSIYCFK
ncbi:PQQ-binding-like beta-propeller repeat protein [Bacteroidota bacterium]